MQSLKTDTINGTIYTCKDVILVDGVETATGRVYSKEALASGIEAYQAEIYNKRAYGELYHGHTNGQVDLEHVSHKVLDLAWVGPELIVNVEILKTPKGKLMENLIDEKYPLKLRPRGIASMVGNVIQNDYKLISIDVLRDLDPIQK